MKIESNVSGGSTELTGGYRSSEQNLESNIPISSRVDPTHVMPPFDEGKAVDSMSAEEARAEWNAMTIDKGGKYRTWPSKNFSDRRLLLFKKGFGEGIAQQQKLQAEAGRRRAEEAKVKLQDYTDELHEKKAEKVLAERWQQDTKKEIEFVQGFIAKHASPNFIEYLETSRLGNDPHVVFFAHSLARLVEIYPEAANIIVPRLEQGIREFAFEQRKKARPEKTELTRRGK